MRLLACILILCASLAAAETTEPKLSDAAHARIRDLQLQQKDLETQYLRLQQQMTALQGQFTSITTQVNNEVDVAYTEAKVKKEDWTLDLATLKFTKAEKKTAEIKKP
jgi:hypothetical protein